MDTDPSSPLAGMPLGLLIKHLPPALLDAAMPLVIKELKLTPAKLALLLVRAINPDHILGQVEEALLRGVKHETLKGHKDRGELPTLVNGI